MYALSWFYLYGVGGAIYAVAAWYCVRAGTLDLRDPRERRTFFAASACLVVFAVVHALFQFVLPFAGTGA